MERCRGRVVKPKVDKFTFYDIIIYAARGSSAARRLATSLGSRRWRDDLPERYARRPPYFRGNRSPLVINWGSTVHPSWLEDPRFKLQPVFVNHGDAVKSAIDKLAFFQRASKLDGVPLLSWTEDIAKALEWIGKGKPVLARTKLGGSSGEGIVLASKPEELVDAKLYTRYYPKTHEFRFHIWGDKVIDVTQKRFRGGPAARSGGNTLVRSHSNGWVHTHGTLDLSPGDRDLMGAACVKLVGGLSLQFGAVDLLAILDSPREDGSRGLKNYCICEVNTGPGLENTQTIEAYKNAILELKNNG